MLLRVEVVESDDHALITAIGEIDLGTSDEVADAIAVALAAGHKRVLLDFSEVTFIDSSGLAVLIKAHREAVRAQAAFSVIHPTPPTLKLIRVLGLDQLLSIYDSREQALSQP